MRRTAPLALPLLALPLLAAAAFADEARWSRQVEVERPGTVVLELDGRAAERARIDLGLVGPDGREVHFAVLGPEPAGRRPVKVIRVTPSEAGWQVELDAGPAPPRHDRLRFALAQETAAADVVLEGGGDREGGGWRELARGSLFRLGAGERLQNFELSYPPTEVRLLRLGWPREAGLPELLETEILKAPGDGELLRPLPVDCAAAGKAVDCIFAAPADCGALEVELAPREGPLGYHLFCACDGEWKDRGQGGRRQHGRLRLELEGGRVHRLRLQGETPPQVAGASCRQRRDRLVFEAETAGAYRLVYGRLSQDDRRDGARRPEPDPAAPEAPASLGPEVEAKAPAWPPAVEPGAPLKGRFQRSWPIEKSTSRGQLVALTLPGEVSRITGPYPNSLRIDAGGRQLPYVSATAPQPEKLLATTLRPERVPGEPARSRAGIVTAGTGARVELMLFAAGPFERQLRFELREAPLRTQREKELAPDIHWSCPASPAGGCLLRTDLRVAREGGALDFFVEFADGDNPPLREVEAELWASRTVLYFVDPGGPLTLRWGRDLRNPRYDLAGLDRVLPHQPAAAATLGAELEGGSAEAPRWVLLLAIGLAAAVLLAVLARVIGRHPAS